MSSSISIVHFHLFTLLIISFILANHANVWAFSLPHKASMLNDEQFDLSSDEGASTDLGQGTYHSNYMQAIPNFHLRQGLVRFIPYKKRTIPLELQKALYAHGIVGRRRK